MLKNNTARVTARALWLAAAALVLAIVGGCKSAPKPAPPPKPVTALITIVASADLNPNREGRPSPVLLHIFQLRDGAKFQGAAFDEVTAKSEQVLAPALLGREERMIQPGTTTTLNMLVDPDARLVGVVAEYADLADSQWRASNAASEGGLSSQLKDHGLRITLGRDAAGVTVVPAGGK